MCGRIIDSLSSLFSVSGTITRSAAWLFVFGAVGIFTLQDAAAADVYKLEGQVKLPHAGRVKKKMQAMSFELSPQTMGGHSANEGGMVGGPGQWSSKNTYKYVEMDPLVFLQNQADSRHCVIVKAPKGRIKVEGLDPGDYKLTFAVPDLGYMEMDVTLSAEAADKDGKVKMDFEFEPQGDVIEPQERGNISDKAAKAFEKGVKEFGKGKLKNALKEFEKAVKEDDHYAEAWEYMGMIQHSREEMDDAEKYFRKSLEIDSNSYRSLADLGTILLVKGDAAGARELYEKALLIRPDDPQPRAQLGMALFQLQESGVALDHLVKARTLDSGHFSQPQLLSAEIYRLWGEFGNMKAELEDFLENFPDDPKAEAVKQALAGM